MSVSASRREIHKMLDSLPPEALPDLVTYLEFLRFRTARRAVSDPVKETAAPDLTRQQLIAELDALRAAGSFDHVDSLRDQYPSPALNGVSDQQLRAFIREEATEYRARIFELSDHQD